LYRYDLIRGCRWVDEVAEGGSSVSSSSFGPANTLSLDVPYITDMDYVSKYNIGLFLRVSSSYIKLDTYLDYVCHGDDPVLVGVMDQFDIMLLTWIVLTGCKW